MSAIHDALRRGDAPEVERLVEAGQELEAYDDAGQTPLMAACLSTAASVETVRFLLDHGADPNGLSRAQSGVRPWDPDEPDFDGLAALEDQPELAGAIANLPEMLETIRAMESRCRAREAEAGPERSSVLSMVAGSADLEKIQVLLERGADPNYRSAAGYTPVIHAACAGRIEVIELLLAAGASPDGVTSYNESALSVLSRTGSFENVARLLEWGADPSPLEWTPLHRAAALGTPDELVSLLEEGADLEARDFWERTPMLVAVQAGKTENASLLLERGANRKAKGRCGKTAMHYPIDRDEAPMLRWLLDRGFPADAADDFGGTPLMDAVELGAIACFETLLDEGVDWRGGDKHGEPLISNASHPEIIRRLIELGQSAGDLEDEVLRDWIGLGTRDELPVTEAEFHAGRSRRFGSANPERMNLPFWNAMVRNGWNAWQAAKQFGHDSFDSGEPVWCHDRFGMSLTPLPDGRWVQIAGEHEDHYDPDFCIYNDVTVHDGKGGFEIFGYPEEVFPPTDFHSATLVGDWIYIIGNLSYPKVADAFGHATPVFRLSTRDWHIEQVETRAESPGWIHGHQARIEGNSIHISQGKRYFVTPDGQRECCELSGSYELDLASGTWRKLS